MSGQRSVLLVGGAGAVSSSRDIVGDALAQARARGLRTYVINRPDLLARTPEIRAATDITAAVDPDDPQACVRWVRDRVAGGERFDVVLGLRDSVLPSVAAVTTALGLPGNTPEAVRRSQNKDKCRAELARAGLPQPRLRLCSSITDAAEFIAGTAGPWVVKPRAGQASEGVRLVRGSAELSAAVAELPAAESFLIEEFVDGTEYSVEGVFLGGIAHVLAVTAKQTTPPPGFVEVAHVLPAELPAPTTAMIADQVRQAARALRLQHGLFHTELWITARGIVLGEVHPRPGGDWIHRLLTHAISGLEMFGMIYDDELSGSPVRPRPATQAAASRFLIPPPGLLRRISGWDEVSGHPDVLHAELAVEPGDRIPALGSSADRAGVVLAGADTCALATELAAKLVASVRFDVEPDRRHSAAAD